MFRSIFLATLAVQVTLVLSQPWCPNYTVKIIQGVSSNSKGLTKIVKTYQNVLGKVPNGNNPGPLPSGHRSVNWDAPIVPFDMPGNFFKVKVTRGIQFYTKRGEFRVSNPPDEEGIKDNRFSSFNFIFPLLFETFSPERLFASAWSNQITARFFVPAKPAKAVVSGFGAVFTNVIKKNKTYISYYDKNGCLIKKLVIKPKWNGLSFGGIKVLKKGGAWVGPVIYRVVITLGDTTISARYSPFKNVVVLDDLIYGEPQKV